MFERSKRIIGDQDSLHFLQVGVTIKRGITTQEKVRDNTNSPDVTVYLVHQLLSTLREGCVDEHRFSMTRLLEYFGSHVAWGAARCREDVKGFFVHYPGQTEVGYQKVCIILGRSEE